jgi:hypothetical protein
VAISLGDDNITATKSDRAWRIEVFIDDADVVRLVFHREQIWKVGGEVRHRKTVTPVKRTQAQIAATFYTAGGVTRTGNQILALLNKMSDDERQADIDSPPPPTP